MLIEITLLIIALIWLSFATYFDIKTQEIPDWLSYSLIIIAIVLKLLHSITTNEWGFFYQGLIAGTVFFGIGSLAVAFGIIIKHHPHLKNKAKKGVKHLLITGSLGTLALILITLALTKGPVSLISLMFEIQPALIFIITIVLSKFIPKLVKESLDRKVLIQKGVGVLLIILGTVLITVV